MSVNVSKTVCSSKATENNICRSVVLVNLPNYVTKRNGDVKLNLGPFKISPAVNTHIWEPLNRKDIFFFILI